MATLQGRLDAFMVTASLGDLASYVNGFERSLRSTNRAPATLEKYGIIVRQLLLFLDEAGMPAQANKLTREHVEAFLEDSLTRNRASTVATQHQALLQFFKYLVGEGELTRSPMANMKAPIVPEEPVPVLTLEELERLLKTCGGKSFEDRRDNAIIRLFVDTGMRLSELANLKLADVDMQRDEAIVMGKGRRPRDCPFGARTGQALERYIRARAQNTANPASRSEWLWLGLRGRMTPSGIRQMVWRRSERAGIPRVHPHQLRHTWAHRNAAAGMSEVSLMKLAGWRSRTMLNRYAASTAVDRAKAEARRLSLGDEL